MNNDRGYHHGDLRNALLDVTRELVRERGPRGFSVSEAARRAGVSPSAPYRHFPDRDAMLAGAAQAGFVELERRFSTLVPEQSLVDWAMLIAVEYLGFAREDPARFEVMFSHGIAKEDHADLLSQTYRVQERLEVALEPHLLADELTHRAAELWALSHGLAELVIGRNMEHVLPCVSAEGIARSAAMAWARGVPHASGR